MNTQKPVTILGASGWIGSSLVNSLRKQGRTVVPIGRAELSDWLSGKDDPGAVIYAIGLTADFRERPYETVYAHAGLVGEILSRRKLENFLYLSSTRVYARSASAVETSELPCKSLDPSDLYNLSKLMGESLVLQDSRPGLKVVRLSNVVGPDQPPSTFIGSLIKAAKMGNPVRIEQASSTQKDYIALSDVNLLLPQIAERGRERLYNLGSGRNTSHADVAQWLDQQGVSVHFADPSSSGVSFPVLCIKRLLAEFPAPKQALPLLTVEVAMR
jgi:nucleoside-diphosphate-sugar epimerase